MLLLVLGNRSVGVDTGMLLYAPSEARKFFPQALNSTLIRVCGD